MEVGLMATGKKNKKKKMKKVGEISHLCVSL